MLDESNSSDHGSRIVKELEQPLKDALSRTDPAYGVLEIGNREGGSGVVQLYYIALEGKGRRFVTVDINDVPTRIKKWVEKDGVNHQHFRAEEKNWVRDNKETFAFIFLDAEHDQKAVIEHMKTLAPYLTTGGIMVVDDTNQWPGVPDGDLPEVEGLKRVDYGMKDIDPQSKNHVGYWQKAI